jgi:hypothetical protein
MPTYSYYDTTNGVFTGQVYSGPDRQLRPPAGQSAWPGVVDATRQRLDLATGTLVPYQPPAPADTADTTWQWSEAAWAWQPVLTLAGQFRLGEQALQQALDAGAQAWGYDTLISAASYTNSTAPQFAAEAAALVAWRDDVWLWAAALQQAVQQGQTPYPATVPELLAAMPQQPARPVIT